MAGHIWPMVVAISKPHKIKKHTKKFLRHQGDLFKRISWSRKGTWRRPRGIDSRVRRRFKSNTRTVKIGFGNQANLRHVLRNGFKIFPVRNVKDLEPLLMNNRVFAAQISAGVSAPKRVEILARAKQLDIKVLNHKARVTTQEKF